MKLSQVRHHLPGAKWIGFEDRELRGIRIDSREVEPGELFVAVRGTRVDGHAFIAEAVNRGAAAVVTSRAPEQSPGIPVAYLSDLSWVPSRLAAAFYGFPADRMELIGITGTNGKSTTLALLRAILEAAGRRTGTIGTIAYELGERRLPASLTTPDPVTLHALMAMMLREGCSSCIMEVSSHALAQSRVGAIRFRAGVFTNLTRDHLDYHGSPERYRADKARLFQMLPANAVAVLNRADEASEHFAQLTRARLVWFGTYLCAGWRVRVVGPSLEGALIRFTSEERQWEVRTSLLGYHNVGNVLAAVACAIALGVSPEAIRRGVESVPYVRGRLEPVCLGQPFEVLIDYAHTPDALENVLTALRPHTRGRLITLFGCGGDRDRGKRPLMGGVVEQLSDLAVVTSDNPRTEDPQRILQDLLAGMKEPQRYIVELDRGKAVHRTVELAQPGDIVLIAGKGHETYQSLGDTVRPFDDRAVAEAAIRRHSELRAAV